MLSKVLSGAIVGLDAVPVEVEVDIAAGGLPSFTIVGLPDKAVEEAKERVRTAIRNSGADFPVKKIVVNLAPADLPKEGPSYDLPIALGILVSSEQLKTDLSSSLVFGELSLDGSLRHTNGVLPLALMAKDRKLKDLYLPQVNAREASIISGLTVYPVESLKSLCLHLAEEKLIQPQTKVDLKTLLKQAAFDFDMVDIVGQEVAKRALEIAAAGAHNILLKGPPGAGKTMLARTLPSILPDLSVDEVLEVTKIYSICGLIGHDEPLVGRRPFRSPHHTTSYVGLVGGGNYPRPGEISLSHRGVLFLDELPEFPRHVLEALRQPLEDGYVTIARSAASVRFPCQFMLVAAQNPCPCGFLGDMFHACSCSSAQVTRYQKKISGPLLDRIDIHIDVPAVKVEKLNQSPGHGENSAGIRSRVQKARNLQIKRLAKEGIFANADMTTKMVKKYCQLTDEAGVLLKQAISQLGLSARSYHKVIKIARTIADLESIAKIGHSQIAEALQYRPKQ
ncbi:YifB family Mg chelatase-like AAA ATPase [Candidatus Daviesbacteria bacterium]|nr:YifB family Mg chelatase-like AAA ATPase [Candidatus Daviesbacteria bacterium]